MNLHHLCYTLLYLSLAALLTMTGCASNTPNNHKPAIAVTKSADRSQIVYATRGHGEPTIVFVHCWTCDHSFWDAQIEYFSKRYQTVWLDLAGHGESRNTQRKNFTMQAFGADVAAVVNHLGATKVILVGHSMGGPVVVEAAKQLGDRVVGIVGVDTFYTPFQYPTSQQAIATFVKPFEDDYRATSEKMLRSMFTPQADPVVIDSIINKFASADPEIGVSAMYELFDWNTKHASTDLQRFSDKLYNINAASIGSEPASNAHIMMIPGVGHFIAQLKPDAFNQALQEIINTLIKPK